MWLRVLLGSIGGQSAPPSLKASPPRLSVMDGFDYRGAVRPPFIEGGDFRKATSLVASYRGAVRPPFIEGDG